jgi:hypothetical protein
MDQNAIVGYVAEHFAGVNIARPSDGPGAGDTFFIYDPAGDLEPNQQHPFATIVTKDYGDFDNASNLNREGVFRLNVGLSRDTFRSLIQPSEQLDYAALDRLLPHPVYATQSWVSILNPSQATFATLIQPLLGEAYHRAVERHNARHQKSTDR